MVNISRISALYPPTLTLTVYLHGPFHPGSSSSYLPSLDLVVRESVVFWPTSQGPLQSTLSISTVFHKIAIMHTKEDLQIAQCAHGTV